ncbi:hypothetical protein SLA2020_042640 [Shorea laevis]
MQRLKGKKGALALKIDLHKAFDSVDWGFLKEVLIDFNLLESLIKLIMFSVTSLQLSIIWNGEKLPYFQPQRGLHQGNPLSPYLFIMVMEKLSYMILSRLQQHQWKPFKISRGGLPLSHLFFIDDLMLFGTTSLPQVEIIMDCLSEFARRSRLELNLSKSKLSVSPNVQRHLANSYSSACGIPLTSDLGSYLGIPILHDRSKPRTYKYILEKMQLKLARWKQNLLSMVGRRTLIQAVTSSIPIYTMQTVLLPSSICSKIDILNRKFLWAADMQSNKPHLVNWNDVCLPKKYGGLGLKSARDRNKVLIAKLGWHMLSRSKKLWCQAFIHKYLHSKSFLSCNPTPSSSVTWRSILKCRDVLHLGMRWRVGSGMQIRLWHDVWAGNSKLLEVALSPIPHHLLDLTVAAIINNSEWDLEQLTGLLPDHLLQTISAIPLPIQSRLPDIPEAGEWAWIWQLCCPEQVKLFVWLLKKERILTNSVHFDGHMASTPVCPRCEQSLETPFHLFRDCYYSRLVWDATSFLPEDFFQLDFAP